TSVVEGQLTNNKKFFFGWWIVLGTIIGVSLGYSVISMSFGTFIKEFQTSFGWSRGEISFGATVIGITAIFFFPYVGTLVDKHGVRKVMLPSIIAFGFTIMAMSLITDSIWHLYAMCVLIPIFGAGTAPMTYSRILVSWFNKKRGLALGLGLSGVGLGTTIVPFISGYFIEHYSWREAYLAIGMLIIVVVFPIAYFLFKEKPADLGLTQDGVSADEVDEAQADPSNSKTVIGYTAKEALKTKSFWLMAGSFLITGLTTSTVLVHLVPMMMDRGMTLQEAIGTFAYLGLSIVGGRLIAGYLMDRFFAPFVVVIFLIGPVIGLAFFAMGASGFEATICTGLIGIAIGAEFDVMAFFTSRYFGQRSFGAIYGYNYSAFKVGASVGPLIMGISYDQFGRYTEVLWAMSGVMLIACILVLLLGKYPQLPKRERT
ncbi:MAG: MFS transporter, partial [Gammaproteobacteria bacterium]|nr:MFS transporter [Gammaproteobacteria bacterium]